MPTYGDYVKKTLKNWVGPKGHLGRFAKMSILIKGHNQTPKGETIEQCFARCAKMSTIRKRTCETNCAINQ